MSSISSTSGYSTLASYASYKNNQKTQTSSVVDKLFEQLDTKDQGFLDKSELQTALTSASANAGGSSASADDMFKAMDADGDGKITKSELSDTLQSVMDKVDNLAASMRVRASRGDAKDEGFTKDQLVQMASDTSTTDSKRSAFMSNVAENFTEADSNGDGKVNRDEAMAYAKATGQEQGPEGTQSAGAQGVGGPQGAGGPPPGSPPGGASSDDSDDSTATASTDPADTNGDGKVSAKEAVEYLLSQLATAENSAKSDDSSSTSTKKPELNELISRQILQLVKTYGGNAAAANDSSTSTGLSASA